MNRGSMRGRAMAWAPPPTRIALVGVDGELAAYLGERLRARWPAVDVVALHAADAGRGPAPSLCIVLSPAAVPVEWPVLVVEDLARSQRLQRVGPHRWRIAAPPGGPVFLEAVAVASARAAARGAQSR